ncbi:Butyrophilin-like protein 9 [Triplophysa tibetana]|uniref:Butyrophilin-like protein 9 n=1 Tax=Triplophysa tibetana TaxID=1572043 RepID=A0A5A9N888_9TELE|nr:Butyrophilin-like protein 9 [Triplophysa tibetana]
MHISTVHFLSTLLMIADGFTVKGPSGPLVVPLGGSVLLPCSVDSLSSLKDLEVKWRRSYSQTLIHLYQDGDIRPEVQHEDYSGRAHFFTDDIMVGNFSLLLVNVTAEDEGQYTCKVHSGQESGETVVEIKVASERLIVSGSNTSLSVYVGEDVTLNCSVDSHIPPEEVSWKKTDKDEHILVLLYLNEEVHPEASDEQYTDRVEFFSDEIHRGNFSLRLKRVRTEDKGVYMCQVFAGQLSDNATVTLQQLGFSGLHIMVLILCIAACGSAVIICCLIYCTSQNKGFTVKGPSGPLVVPLGGSVLLPCSVDSLLSVKDLEVEWKRSDSQTLIHLYEDGDNGEVVQNEDYRDRAHFYTEDLKHENFSLLLKNLRKEDEGNYTCKVYSGTVFSRFFHSNLVQRLQVKGPSGPLVVPLGGSVLLPCSVDSLLSLKDLEVHWKRSDSQTLIHLYQDGDIRPEVQNEDYHDRAHFFTEDIKHGNFSLLLKNVRQEDEGQYTCTVHSGQESGETVVEIKDVDYFTAVYSCDLVVPLGGSVLLPWFKKKPFEGEIKKVEWRKSGLQKPVFVYEDGDIRPKVQHEDYHDRAHFISDDIKHGNFSLLLKNVRQEDEGQYTCEVYRGQESGVLSLSTKLEPRLLGKSTDKS